MAEKLFEKALKIHRRIYGKDSMGVLWLLSRLGNTYLKLGKKKKALELLEKNLNLREDYYGKNHFKLMQALTYLGNIYTIMGQPAVAKKHLQRAEKIKARHASINSA